MSAADRGRPPESPHARARYFRVPQRRSPWLSLLAWGAWMLIGTLVAIGVSGYVFLDDTLEAAAPDTEAAKEARRLTKPVLAGEPVNVLLIGSDTRPEEGDPGRSDSLILVRMDARRGFISMLSFPRDLYVEIPGSGLSKINNAYGWGGPALTIRTVENLVDEPVNEYVVIDFKGFERLVDEVGGVYLDVDRRYFNDNSGPVKYDMIDLEPGYQRLDGHDALDYVRYRHTDSDFARIARQQQFLSDLKRQTNRLGNLTKITSFRKIFKDNIETSIDDVPRFIDLLSLALTTEKDQIARVSLSGVETMRDEAAVVIPDPAEVAQRVSEWREPEFLGGAPEKKVLPQETVVTVQNGSGRALVAADMAALLRGKGYDARAGGNAEDFGHTATEVFYAEGERAAGKAIRQLVGANATIAQARDAGGADVVVVIGTDFTGRLAPPPPPPPKVVPEVVATRSLVPVLRRVQGALGLKVLIPLKVAESSRVRRVHPYFIKTGKGKGAPAVKMVFETGYQKYWGMMMTSMRNPPILEGRTGVIKSGGREYYTYYDGKNMQRLAWRIDGTTYWITNTLDYALTAETIQEIAKSTRPLGRAKLKKGVTATEIEVELEAPTP